MGRDRDSYVMLCSLCKQLACTDFHCVYSWDCASHFFTFLAPSVSSVCRSRHEVRNIFPSMSVPREYYFDGCDDGFLDDRGGNMINPRVGHPLYLQAGA